MAEISENVKQSLGRCLLKGDIMSRFYEIFLDSHPDIRPKFTNTDFSKQKRLLRQGINFAIMFADDVEFARSRITRIRTSHSKANLNIPPHLYPYWKKSFIEAVSEIDPQFSPQLAKNWDSVLQKTIDYVIDGYNE